MNFRIFSIFIPGIVNRLGSTIESNRTRTKKYGQANPIDRLISLLLTFIKIGVRGAEINNRRVTPGHTWAWRGIS